MTGARLRQALEYAAFGWPVFPCNAGQKTPAPPHGYRDATTGRAQITVCSRGPSSFWPLAIGPSLAGPD